MNSNRDKAWMMGTVLVAAVVGVATFALLLGGAWITGHLGPTGHSQPAGTVGGDVLAPANNVGIRSHGSSNETGQRNPANVNSSVAPHDVVDNSNAATDNAGGADPGGDSNPARGRIAIQLRFDEPIKIADLQLECWRGGQQVNLQRSTRSHSQFLNGEGITVVARSSASDRIEVSTTVPPGEWEFRIRAGQFRPSPLVVAFKVEPGGNYLADSEFEGDPPADGPTRVAIDRLHVHPAVRLDLQPDRNDLPWVPVVRHVIVCESRPDNDSVPDAEAESAASHRWYRRRDGRIDAQHTTVVESRIMFESLPVGRWWVCVVTDGTLHEVNWIELHVTNLEDSVAVVRLTPGAAIQYTIPEGPPGLEVELDGRATIARSDAQGLRWAAVTRTVRPGLRTGSIAPPVAVRLGEYRAMLRPAERMTIEDAEWVRVNLPAPCLVEVSGRLVLPGDVEFPVTATIADAWVMGDTLRNAQSIVKADGTFRFRFLSSADRWHQIDVLENDGQMRRWSTRFRVPTPGINGTADVALGTVVPD